MGLTRAALNMASSVIFICFCISSGVKFVRTLWSKVWDPTQCPSLISSLRMLLFFLQACPWKPSEIVWPRMKKVPFTLCSLKIFRIFGVCLGWMPSSKVRAACLGFTHPLKMSRELNCTKCSNSIGLKYLRSPLPRASSAFFRMSRSHPATQFPGPQ